MKRDLDRELPRLPRGREILRERLPERPRLTREGLLEEVGMYRVATQEEVLRWRYAGDEERGRKDIAALARKGWLHRQGCPGRAGEWTVLTLTREGVREAQRRNPGGGQRYWSGIPRQSDLEHDCEIYARCQENIQELEAGGCTITRVQLGDELKGRISGPVPDARIGYETPERTTGRVDIEITTRSYSQGKISRLRAAGMSIYGLKTFSKGHVRDPRIAEKAMEL